MRVNIALFADNEFQQIFQPWQDEICQKYAILPENRNYWPHISLKQPFWVEGFEEITSYFDEFAATVPAQELSLSRLNLWRLTALSGDTGALFLEVAEQNALRALHERLNAELASRFANTTAPFDGPDYHFHLTLAVGGAIADIYERIYQDYQDCWHPETWPFTAISLGYYDEQTPENGWQIGKTHLL